MSVNLIRAGVVAVLLAGCGGTTYAADPQPVAVQHDLVIIGDSVLNFSRRHFDRGIIDAQSGRSAFATDYGDESSYSAGWGEPGTAEMAVGRLLPSVAADGWLVIEIATNDARRGTPTEEFTGWVRSVAARLPDDRCLAWVTPSPLWMPEEAAALTAAIRSGVRDQPCYAVVEWGAAVAADHTLVVEDGVHPTEMGSERFAQLVYETIGAPRQAAITSPAGGDLQPAVRG